MTGSSYPYRYERTATVRDVRERFGDIEPGSETGTEVRLAGRLRTVRGHGKLAFADLEDATGRIQLFARQDVMGDDGMDAFKALGVGDIVGAEGQAMKTRRGELSVSVTAVTLLAPTARPMPDNWHGISDVEARYRQRYLDLIVNEDARRPIEARAAANAAIRSFMEERDFLEVETPLLQPIAGGAVARPFVTHHNALDIDLYLRVAPELYLKRLLIGGFERVYELNRSFRNEGVSSQHNPEFTMLEAYEAYADWQDTMAFVEDLVRTVVRAIGDGLQIEVGTKGAVVDLEPPFERITLFEAVERVTGHDLSDAWESDDGVLGAARELDVSVDPSWPRGKVLMEIFESTTEKKLQGPVFVVGFPKDVSPLAKDHRTIPDFTEQADLIVAGVELAPIYSELNDPEEQKRRFERQAAARAGGDEEANVPDEDFLEALAYGMPPAGGFGLGVDRLLTMALGFSSLREVIAFPTLRPQS